MLSETHLQPEVLVEMAAMLETAVQPGQVTLGWELPVLTEVLQLMAARLTPEASLAGTVF